MDNEKVDVDDGSDERKSNAFQDAGRNEAQDAKTEMIIENPDDATHDKVQAAGI